MKEYKGQKKIGNEAEIEQKENKEIPEQQMGFISNGEKLIFMTEAA